MAFCARFDRPTLEVETIRYFQDDSTRDPFDNDPPPAIPRQLIYDLGFFLVPADRTWDAVITFASELFRRVVTTGEGQPSESVIGERDRLRQPHGPLEADPALAGIISHLDRELAGFFRSEPRLRLRLTSTDSAGVLEAVVAHYAHSDGSLPLPARRHGSGLVSLQRVLLLLHFGRQRATEGLNFWMALEEPELHVPPALQRRLVNRLQALSSQTFVSTHSPLVAALADPTTVSILHNNRGELSTSPLRSDVLPAETPNSVRKLFQLHRLDTIAALMHDAVLVPEGQIDKAWIDLLVRAVDATQGWSTDTECHFGSYVGVAPTQDGAVLPTFEVLRDLHATVIALVDGDAAGIGYTDELVKLKTAPTIIIRWPNAWSIEDVVGWILSADESATLAALRDVIQPAPASVAELVVRLKSVNRSIGGLKQDHIAYEGIADAIARTPTCVARSRTLLNAISELALGRSSELFLADPLATSLRIFQP